MLDEIRFWAIVGEELRRTVIVSPENESRVKCWLAARWPDGLYRVVVQPWVGDDVVYVVDENAVEAAWREQCQRPVRWDIPSPAAGPWYRQPPVISPADMVRITIY